MDELLKARTELADILRVVDEAEPAPGTVSATAEAIHLLLDHEDDRATLYAKLNHLLRETVMLAVETAVANIKTVNGADGLLPETPDDMRRLLNIVPMLHKRLNAVE